ncbi:RnfABCDGE type electron transport complex subunit B [Salinicola endophyticus]|uniref:RnfABCDGE type electron transport complex subunit B n=1 Tax=Salinicola endophyticus TaxID=1949083 RepID=A0ABY8FK61_9GAMM|nr:RnfABCDGE type electron transport complex subunit B [Salinicola endophyticus]WFF43188.1 RnfABCDGE type electron transport complex subunit B [Salinicola endophyticus]
MSLAEISVERIDAELPQTQCGKCGHPGCRPYAEAIVAGEAVNRCPPGGEATRDRLAALTGRPALALIEPAQTPLLAVIREAECIGCTKCIQACPVDAILGAAKQMHSVIASECTGCELCVAPCPVDCIDLVAHPQWQNATDTAERQRYLDWRAANGRRRFEARNRRLVHKAEEKRRKRERRLAATRAQAETAAPSAAVDATALKAQRATLSAKARRLQRQRDQASGETRAALDQRLAALEAQRADIERQLGSTPSAPAAPTVPHIAVAAAEQALRKARQTAARLEREGKHAEAERARAQVSEAETHLRQARGAKPTSHETAP